jgi:hypothetical protein
MRCEILPEICLEVPRLESDIWIPVGPNVERRATLQIRHMRLWGRSQSERRVQDGRNRAGCLSEQFEAGITGRDDGPRSQFGDQDAKVLDHLRLDSGGRTRSATP